jgi:hypothetical protein
VQPEKTEITERVTKIVFMDTGLSEAAAIWQGNLLIRPAMPPPDEFLTSVTFGLARQNHD